MATRQEKIQIVIDGLKRLKDEEFDFCPTITFYSTEVFGRREVSASDAIKILRLLEGQPNCIKYTYKERYENFHDGRAHAPWEYYGTPYYDLYYNMPESMSVHEQKKRSEALENEYNALEITVEFLEDFEKGAQCVIDGLLQPSSDVLEIFFQGYQIWIRELESGAKVCIKQTTKSPTFQEFIDMVRDADEVLVDIKKMKNQHTYDNVNFLKNMFAQSAFYGPFCEISDGKIRFHRFATKQDLSKNNTSIEDIWERAKNKNLLSSALN